MTLGYKVRMCTTLSAWYHPYYAFAKNGTKPTPYHKEPYGMKFAETDSKTVEGKPEKTTTEIQALNASAKFASIMTQWNKQFENKKGGEGGMALTIDPTCRLKYKA